MGEFAAYGNPAFKNVPILARLITRTCMICEGKGVIVAPWVDYDQDPAVFKAIDYPCLSCKATGTRTK